MLEVIKDWYRRHFSDPQVVILALLLLAGLLTIIFMGNILAPVIAALVIAYLLDGGVAQLLKLHLPRLLAVSIVFSLFMAFLLVVTFWLVPLLSQQLSQFVRELPNMVSQGQTALLQLPERYPEFVSEEQVRRALSAISSEVTSMGQTVISWSLSSFVGVVTFLVYLVLVPVTAFFLLKDKYQILAWSSRFLPADRGLANKVWHDVNDKIASYVRGKFVEILLVWVASYVTFKYLGVDYAMLLSALVGLSVIIPYIGAIVVTLPVALVGYFQWGASQEFLYLVLAYGVIQFFDANLLVPLLFSEVVNLHPVAIIVAVLFFGGIWGVWGVFFAIPLASLLQAVLDAWPRQLSAGDQAEEG